MLGSVPPNVGAGLSGCFAPGCYGSWALLQWSKAAYICVCLCTQRVQVCTSVAGRQGHLVFCYLSSPACCMCDSYVPGCAQVLCVAALCRSLQVNKLAALCLNLAQQATGCLASAAFTAPACDLPALGASGRGSVGCATCRGLAASCLPAQARSRQAPRVMKGSGVQRRGRRKRCAGLCAEESAAAAQRRRQEGRCATRRWNGCLARAPRHPGLGPPCCRPRVRRLGVCCACRTCGEGGAGRRRGGAACGAGGPDCARCRLGSALRYTWEAALLSCERQVPSLCCI